MSRVTNKIKNAFNLSLRDGIMVIIGVVLAIVFGGLIMIHNSRETVLTYQPAGVTAAWIPDSVKRWTPQINEMAEKYDINANLVAVIVTMESGGDPKAKSEAGAEGLMQITPLTAKDISQKYVKSPVSTYDIYDPKTNIEFGTAYLAMLRDQYGIAQYGPDHTRSVELIATAYNAGFGAANALESGEGLRDTQPVIYSRDAFNMWRERVSKTSPTFDRWKERGGSALLDAAAKN